MVADQFAQLHKQRLSTQIDVGHLIHKPMTYVEHMWYCCYLTTLDAGKMRGHIPTRAESNEEAKEMDVDITS